MESELVVSVAWPALSVPVPSVAAPSMKVTVPVGVPAAGATGVTVAVNVTDCPDTDGFTDDVTVVELLALFTVCDSAADVLLAKLPSVA